MGGSVRERLESRFDDAIEKVVEDRGELTLWIDRDRVHDVLGHCKRELAFDFCMDVTAVDHLELEGEPRFAVVWHLFSLSTGERIRVKASVPEDDPVVATATDVWKSTDWFEREVYDMFGIRFEGHPNMKRILCHEDFQGHALRKDYPADLRWKLTRPDDLVDEISAEEMERMRSLARRRLSD